MKGSDHVERKRAFRFKEEQSDVESREYYFIKTTVSADQPPFRSPNIDDGWLLL